MNGRLNVHIYRSDITNASRILRISKALQDTGSFRATHLVGIKGSATESFQDLADGRIILRLGGPPHKGSSSRVRSIVLWHVEVVLKYVREDVAVVHAHHVWQLPSAWLISKVAKAKLVYATHELETETPTMVGIKRHFAKLVECVFIRRCHLVTCVNASIADWYKSEYHISRPVVARNIPVLGAEDGPTNLRRLLDIAPDPLLFIHTGALTEGRNIDLILRVFTRPDVEAHVVFLGNGQLRRLVQEAADDCPRVHLLDPVPHDEVVSYTRGADVALCLIEATRLSYKLSSPNKLFEALAAGTPPLCSDLPEAEKLLGPSLYRSWHLEHPDVQLAGFVQRVAKVDVDRFRREFGGLPTWDEEVRAFLEECRAITQ